MTTRISEIQTSFKNGIETLQMAKPNQEAGKIEQLLTDPWAVDIEKYKPVKNAENYLLVTMKNMFEYWYNDANAQRANQ